MWTEKGREPLVVLEDEAVAAAQGGFLARSRLFLVVTEGLVAGLLKTSTRSEGYSGFDLKLCS